MDVKSDKPASTVLIPVFIPAVIVIALIVIGTISNPQMAGDFLLTLLTPLQKLWLVLYVSGSDIFSFYRYCCH